MVHYFFDSQCIYKCSKIQNASINLDKVQKFVHHFYPSDNSYKLSKMIQFFRSHCQRRNQEFYFGGAEAHGERGARGYNGGLGAEPPARSRGRAPGQGVRGKAPPEAESFFVDVRP